MNFRQLLAWLETFRRRTPSGPPPPPAPPRPTPRPTPPPAATRSDLVVAINSSRAVLGRPPLAEDARLTALAQSWANAMAFHAWLDHGNFAGRLDAAFPHAAFPHAASAENIAAGQQTAAEVVADWLASPGHRANLLGDFNLLGVGSARSATGLTYWCADFFVRTPAR